MELPRKNNLLHQYQFCASQRLCEKPKNFEVDTLDAIVKKQGIKKVDFIKMNIKVAEIEALIGQEKL